MDSLPGFVRSGTGGGWSGSRSGAMTASSRVCQLLIVESGGETTGLLVSGGEHVEAARAVLDAGTGGGVVVTTGDRLLAGRRLGSARDPGDRSGAWAVVVPSGTGASSPWWWTEW